ncbi:MAG: NADH-quinone oxidoreductase subunit A [Bacteroidetes bacterium]|nr:NADH-quinone oxidoreductase subunit A [Bacteroidota bacterium]
MPQTEISEFGKILLYLIGSTIFIAGGMLTSRLLAPRRPNPEKNAPYECGEEPLGSAWAQFNVRYYVMGLVFLVFDVEILLLFPWATAYAHPLLKAQPGWMAFAVAEAFVFMGILALGLAYIWRKGDIRWIIPRAQAPAPGARISPRVYAEWNEAAASRQVAESQR